MSFHNRRWIFLNSGDLNQVDFDQLPLVDQHPNQPMSVRYCHDNSCLLYTSPSPRDVEESRMPSSA